MARSFVGGARLALLVLLSCTIQPAAQLADDSQSRRRLEDIWARHHANASRPMLVLLPQYGLGNRMLSAISALALAIATDRRLFIAWEDPFEGLFESPFPSGWLPPASELSGPASGSQRRHAKVLDMTASSASFSRCKSI